MREGDDLVIIRGDRRTRRPSEQRIGQRLVGGCDEELAHYAETLRQELVWIDRLVQVCYAARRCFRLFTAATMLYFAAATTYEHRRARRTTGSTPGAYLCADDPSLQSLVSRIAPADWKGGALGAAQAAASMGRILGPVWAGLAFTVIGVDWPFVGGAMLLMPVFVLAIYARRRIGRHRAGQ